MPLGPLVWAPPNRTPSSVTSGSRTPWFCPGGGGVGGDPTRGFTDQMVPELEFCQRSFFSTCTVPRPPKPESPMLTISISAAQTHNVTIT